MKYNTAVKLIWASVIAVGGVISSEMTNSYADSTIAQDDGVTLEVTSSCYISSTVTSAHTATISNGTSQSNIGSTSIKTVCNDPLGYALYAVGYDTEMGDGVTNLKTNDGLTIATGLATSGATSAWAMKLSAVDGTYKPTIQYASDYAVVPSELTKVAYYEHIVGSDEGSTITTTYRAYVSPTQAAGTYSGKVKYTLLHPDNAPGGLASITTMQQMTSTICNASNIGEIAYLKDARDDKYYRVGKMRDGNCWMIDNLRFAGTNAEGNQISITASNSDLGAEGIETGYSFDLIDTTPNQTAYTASTSWTNTNVASEYYPSEDKTNGTYYGYYYNWYAAVAGTVSGNTQATAPGSICPKGWQLPIDSVSTEDDTKKSFARLLYASGVINSNTNIGMVSNVGYAGGGWDNMQAAPLYFLRAGLHDSSSIYVYSRDNYGRCWSASSSSGTSAYLLYFDSDSIYPRYNSSKAYGFSIRCVAR